MRGYMSAAFRCQGYVGPMIYEPTDIGLVSVCLETDGVAVRFGDSRADGRPPALTPDGWMELAWHARRLVDDANAAWKAMGAMSDA